MGSFGTTEIILIVAVLFLLFGASRLPQLAKSFGQTRKAFKDGMKEADEEERLEEQQKQLNSTPVAAPQINNLSDEQLTAEMRRRAEVK
ncbi:MAG: twin-arginine translocase TatA/TatE family subunit [Pyrinomonadaceae bacterium]|nr:twin-arginine translocase TatA/TatE family subunit [Pyrinomonadaceae bacterium]